MKYATFFQTAYINFIFYMDEFNKPTQWDLRETRFSENYQLSIEIIDKQQAQNQFQYSKNMLIISSSEKIENGASENLLIRREQSVQYQSLVNETQNNQLELQMKIQQNYQPFSQISKSFSYLNDQQAKGSFQLFINDQIPVKNCLNENKYEDEAKSNSSDSEDVFSQKISLIRDLQKKLQSLHERIKIPNFSSSSSYLNEYKVNLQKEYQTFSTLANTGKQVSKITNNNQNKQINQLSQIQSQVIINSKIKGNDSIQSEEMLLDKDYFDYEKEIPTKKIIGRSMIEERPAQIQIIQTVRIVQVPYLIQINREIQQKIQSKKSFYFEQNEQIHKTFEEFTQRESVHQQMLNIETKIKPETNDGNRTLNEHQLEYSIGPSSMPKPINSLDENSMLSGHQSNRTYHNIIKQKVNDLSYEENNEILSKLLTKHNNGQIEQLEEKITQLEIQNTELKEKLTECNAQKVELEHERENLSHELQRYAQYELIYHERLNSYRKKLQFLQEQFADILHSHESVIKEEYEKQIEHFQNEQAEYASRIIAFEQHFEEQRQKEANITELIDRHQEQIQSLHKAYNDKQIQLENEILKRKETQDIVIQREKQLKTIIENLEKDNLELKNMMIQLQIRYESEGFYILKEQAEQLKKTIEEKDLIHIEELDKLQSRYNVLIEKYQNQLQNMKKGLEKVRVNRSTSVSNNQNYLHTVITGPKGSRNQIPLKKRESIRTTKISHSMSQSLFEIQQKLANQSLNLFEMKHVEQIKNSQNQNTSLSCEVNRSIFKRKDVDVQDQRSQDEHKQRLNEVLLFQIQHLKEQNCRIHSLLVKEKQEKQSLSQKLIQISSLMSKYMSHINESEFQTEKNQEVFLKCVEQLQKQYLLNKNLKQKLQKVQNSMKNRTRADESDTSFITDETIKVHPIYIQLSQKYQKSRKYIKVLEKQILDLSALPEFNSKDTKKCCKSKHEDKRKGDHFFHELMKLN